MKIAIKNLKIVQALSEETLCFTATLWLDGAKAATVTNRGHGGPNDYHFDDPTVRDQFGAWCKAQPLEFKFEEMDQIVDRIITKMDEERTYKRWCRANIVYRLAGDAQGQWRQSGYKGVRTLQPHHQQALRQSAIGRHGDKIEEILNDRFA